MQIEFTSKLPSGCVVVFPVYEGISLSSPEDALDKKSKEAIKSTLKKNNFTGKKGEIFTFFAPSFSKFFALTCIGMGDKKKQTPQSISAAIANAIKSLLSSGEEVLYVATDSQESAVNGAFGALLGSYAFTKYRTQTEISEKPSLNKVFFLSPEPKKSAKDFAFYAATAQGIYTARDLISEPANVIYPETFVKQAKERLAKTGLDFKVLGRKELEKIGADMLLAVAQGSTKEPQLLIVKWLGDKSHKDIKVALVGKGVCFDSGGISLKPSKGMEAMKYDMAGAAAVLGTMETLALSKVPLNVVGVIPLVENMPSGSASRPGDIVTSLSGKTVEIINTDCEGRLILGDALTYAAQNYKPQIMIDIATLTGLMKMTLGHNYAGLFAADKGLGSELIKAGEESGERLWPFPMDEEYKELIKSDIADIKNHTDSPEGGSITAAKFLENFVGDDAKWAHLDIAGTAWDYKGSPLTPKGACGFGVRLFTRFIKNLSLK